MPETLAKLSTATHPSVQLLVKASPELEWPEEITDYHDSPEELDAAFTEVFDGLLPPSDAKLSPHSNKHTVEGGASYPDNLEIRLENTIEATYDFNNANELLGLQSARKLKLLKQIGDYSHWLSFERHFGTYETLGHTSINLTIGVGSCRTSTSEEVPHFAGFAQVAFEPVQHHLVHSAKNGTVIDPQALGYSADVVRQFGASVAILGLVRENFEA